MVSPSNCSTQRKPYLDLLRILAILLVLFNHTGAKGYSLCTVATESPFFFLYLFCSAFCKIAVPIFLMVSGALLLKKDESISVMLKKRFLRFLFILILSSFVVYVYLLYPDYSKFSLIKFTKKLYSANIATPLWYLYAYIAFLLTLPFLRKMSKNMESKDYIYLTGIMLAFSVMKVFELVLLHCEIRITSHFNLFTISQIVYYPLMGDYLANKLPDSQLNRKSIFAIGLAGILFLLANCWLTCKWCGILGKWEYSTFENHISRFVFIPAISVFICIRYLFAHVHLGNRMERAILYVGSCTFGIYLFERIYREKTLFVFYALDPYLPRLIACLVWILYAFVLGLFVTALLKKIPIINKLI